MSRRIKSLQLRLMVELAALFFVASCLAVGGLIYSASLTAGSLADRELGLRAEDLARYVSPDENRKPRLSLPPPLKQAYSAAAQQSVTSCRPATDVLLPATGSTSIPRRTGSKRCTTNGRVSPRFSTSRTARWWIPELAQRDVALGVAGVYVRTMRREAIDGSFDNRTDRMIDDERQVDELVVDRLMTSGRATATTAGRRWSRLRQRRWRCE